MLDAVASRSFIRTLLATATLALLLGSAPLAAVQAAAAPATDDLTIQTASGNHHFTVEVMRSREELERGLMFRKTMAADRGMLFDFGSPQPVSMWMKNTYLPLDMLFIAADGRVVSVKQNAQPQSEAIIPSGGDVLGVLELNGGAAGRIGVKAGDHVVDPMFKP
ncbi:MAG: DUF192 domain-containing protein [Janthinobacterium lividum]